MIEYHNNIAIIKNATHWTEWVKKQNKLDVDGSAHLISKKYLKPSDTVLDIGANIGSHSIVYCSQITELGKLYAIDPDPEHCLCLKHNLPSWVDIMEIAISDTIGSIGYKQYSNTGCNRCVLDNYDFIEISSERLEELKALKDQSICYHDQEFFQYNFIKRYNENADDLINKYQILMTRDRINGVGPYDINKKNACKVLHISHHNATLIKNHSIHFQDDDIDEIRIKVIEHIINKS